MQILGLSRTVCEFVLRSELSPFRVPGHPCTQFVDSVADESVSVSIATFGTFSAGCAWMPRHLKLIQFGPRKP